MNRTHQGDLFAQAEAELPEGFRYGAAIVPEPEQSRLLEQIPLLPLKPFDFHGFEGKRRVVSFGWKYDFETERMKPAESIPDFLLPVRELAAAFAGIEAKLLEQALVSEYGEGAPIGWHKDKKVFGRVVGLSLLSPCIFRLRRRAGSKWQRVSLTVEPGSAYLLSGAARSEWEHSIPPVEKLRYSITFREISRSMSGGDLANGSG
ncbi:alpha-ketoglutarate-dependent dioxygenase AlkB [Rhizobium leguminosarum bv. viciae]|jgi:alkylated DNA repair dioxygenase AlkB|uniref:Alpha-ketoglutarate-dependent dioxygenase AlkB n=1 Tax=Rhizobium leguminosarum bv. viciae TaxID=387 RepID=A0A8I2H5P9_RHILV|nr:alpha-ketoglutarate-dependent dioxygenase AlkB [Rhizobium leguminosarum]MBY5782028.1 alpha-ketoglutarate-dependent dioxygenase AlkB [Rhizobium leguminosarum]MBY5795115.1 alpha-ketoglutarate-dependent dioxygenase AlkB [Rhizobium leguminosarum]NKM49973.1 alpha-ketoglutarate-dependent dioxygenase AlkB [Rhizobium leguminosarum bv. viciae]NKN02758.1 alpha-ketoglutarate-dependent dioxygenase AlkB [Rhizobium leguminosarum bv. viciae]